MSTTIVLDGHELESKKAEAKSKVISALGSGVSISGDTIIVQYSIDVPKVTQILSAAYVSYSGG